MRRPFNTKRFFLVRSKVLGAILRAKTDERLLTLARRLTIVNNYHSEALRSIGIKAPIYRVPSIDEVHKGLLVLIDLKAG